jgi:hypothetical protein
MAIKALIEARWKAINCGVIALVLVKVSIATREHINSIQHMCEKDIV